MKTLKSLFLSELAHRYDGEMRLAKALPRVASAATCTQFQKLLKSQLLATKGHVKMLEAVFASFGIEAEARTCEATVGILTACDEFADEFEESPAINAALGSSMLKVKTCAITSCGCLHAWALLLGEDEAAGLLREILEDEKTALKALSQLTTERSYPQALDESSGEELDDGSKTDRLIDASMS